MAKPDYEQLAQRVKELEQELANYQTPCQSTKLPARDDLRYRLLVDNAPICIHEIDLDGRLIKMNPAGLKMLGAVDESEICNVPYVDFVGKDNFERISDLLKRALNGEVVEHFEFEIETDNGLLTFESNFIPLFSESGVVSKLMGLTRDITVQRNAEKELVKALKTAEKAKSFAEKAREEAEKASQRKTDFLHMVSHELRTPLHAITSSLYNWQINLNHREQKSILDDVSYGASRLCNQIDNLVLMAETEDDQLEAECYPFAINPLLEKLTKDATEWIESELVNFDFYISEDVPMGFYGDSYLINHLLRAILDNACKFTEAGSITFSCGWDSKQQMLDVRVQDDGIGMSEEQQDQIFQGFTQISRGLTRKSQGMGLGLTLCYRLSNLLAANFSIDSEVNEGTAVSIQIPLKPLEVISKVSPNKDYKGPILIVEDNAVNARVLERLVSRLGHPVELAVSGVEALERVAECAFSLILMDIQMPEMDGIEATRRIRKQGLMTPIMAITANSDLDVRKSCRLAGMNDFLVKPVKPEEIQQKIEEWALPVMPTGNQQIH